MAAFAVSAAIFLGIMGIAVDGSRLHISKNELQNAADACALAAAAALTGANADQLTQAENWGRAAGQQNRVGVQDIVPEIPLDQAITFSDRLNGTFRARSAVPTAEVSRMKYARCTLRESAIRPVLVRVANMIPGNSIGDQVMAASSVASLEPSISNCAIPIAMCKEEIIDQARSVGDWVCGRFDPGNQANQTRCAPSANLQGAYKWIEYPGFTRTPDLAALLSGAGQCNLNNASTVRSHQGFNNSLVQAWNTRFGVYQGGTTGPTTAPPDLTGRAYSGNPSDPWYHAPMRDAYNNPSNTAQSFRAMRAANAPFNANPPGGYRRSTTAEHAAHGGDRRMVVAPIVNCTALTAGGGAPQVPIVDWACMLMLHPVFPSGGNDMWLEYRGRASNLAEFVEAGCASSGLPGGPTAGGPRVPALVQ